MASLSKAPGASPSPETPPLVQKLFGENWEDLDSHPDCWNRWFGPDEDFANNQSTSELSKSVSKELSDPNWIKTTLDTELVRFVVEDLHLCEDRSLMLARSKLILGASVFAIAAQFPFFLTGVFTRELQMVNFACIAVFFVLYAANLYIARSDPPNCILRTQSGLVFETEWVEKYSTDLVITVSRTPGEKLSQVLSATVCFTSQAKLCPEPLHDTVTALVEKGKN